MQCSGTCTAHQHPKRRIQDVLELTTACKLQLDNTDVLPAATLATPAGSGCLHPTQLDILEGDPWVDATGSLAATVAD
jgi:hypothetical protein